MYYEPFNDTGFAFCDEAREEIEDAVIYPSNIADPDHKVYPLLKGIAITLTKGKNDFKELSSEYNKLVFAKNTRWNEFLNDYTVKTRDADGFGVFRSFINKLFLNTPFIQKIFNYVPQLMALLRL